MFPFRCNPMLIKTQLSEKDFKNRIGHNESKMKIESGWVQRKARKENTVVLNYKQTFYRNSFRPVVICSWCSDCDPITINAYLRLPYLTIFFCLTPFVFGMYISYEIASFLPLVTTLFFSCCLIFIVGYLFFRMDRNWVLEEFRKLVSK